MMIQVGYVVGGYSLLVLCRCIHLFGKLAKSPPNSDFVADNNTIHMTPHSTCTCPLDSVIDVGDISGFWVLILSRKPLQHNSLLKTLRDTRSHNRNIG